MTDVFAIQDEISQAIVEKLRVLVAADRPLVKRHTENVEAYNLYLKARYQLLRFSPEGFAKSKEYCERAIALDPNYALAWHGLAEFYYLLGYFGFMPPKAANAQADQATRKALQLDDPAIDVDVVLVQGRLIGHGTHLRVDPGSARPVSMFRASAGRSVGAGMRASRLTATARRVVMLRPQSVDPPGMEDSTMRRRRNLFVAALAVRVGDAA